MAPLSTRSKFLLVLLVLLAASEFIERGPLRFLQATDFNDFISPYLQSRALVEGLDPYSPEVVVRLWPSGEAYRPDFLDKDLADGSLMETGGGVCVVGHYRSSDSRRLGGGKVERVRTTNRAQTMAIAGRARSL